MIASTSTDLTPDDDDNDTTQSFAPTPYKPREIQSPMDQQLSSLIESAIVDAQVQAEMLVEKELETYGPEAPFSEKRLKRNISTLFEAFFRGLPPDERRLITREIKEALKRSYEEEYLATIEEKVQNYRKDGTLYDERILGIRELVRQDKSKIEDLSHSELLRYLGAVRAIGVLLKTSMDVTLKDLHDIRDYVEDYRTHYNTYDPRKEVTNRSIGNTF